MADPATDFISKEHLLQSISKMPEQISIDTLIDEIIFLYKVEVAMKKSGQGAGIPLEAFREKVRTSLRTSGSLFGKDRTAPSVSEIGKDY